MLGERQRKTEKFTVSLFWKFLQPAHRLVRSQDWTKKQHPLLAWEAFGGASENLQSVHIYIYIPVCVCI